MSLSINDIMTLILQNMDSNYAVNAIMGPDEWVADRDKAFKY